ncbi:TIP41-domain-containing protein [Pseudovirgaria hyperparasitica]|uniref:TIP41-domain-containing protein n=1 Tax=Pseudovirgaria hyperparasitica TaxID=470096 RepID=A0A6A6WM12_9PEZI|nr:TIP41-domain-containing protein [Pseudovirgaria hyperparasitica]KAF2763059.1 TIP41-domain-containing protein [Pseudovirgaria hyperparasitica]
MTTTADTASALSPSPSVSLPPPDTQLPTPQSPAVKSISQHGFTISTRKLPILKADPIEKLAERLGIAIPEMIFGDNYVRVEHPVSGWAIEFNAGDALDRVDKTDKSMLKVAYSREWQENRQHHSSDIKEVIKPFDWSYTTDYAGSSPSPASPTTRPSPPPTFSTTDTPLPLHLLARRDPILLFDEVPLYEDELADNGISFYTVKLRVMPQRLLILARFFMRLDDVLFRIRDTRVYIEFETGVVIREYCAREEEYSKVREGLRRQGVADARALSVMRDPNELVQMDLVKVVERKLDGVKVK